MALRLAALLSVVLLLGCSSPPISTSGGPLPDAGADSEPDNGTVESGEAPQQPLEPVTVQVVDKAGYDAELAKHAGKIVVVDFWANWCEPCKERFPHMVELAAQYPPEDVVFFSVSLDEASDQAQVEKFLTEQRATAMVNLLSQLDPVAAFEDYDIRAGIPNYKLYDREGKLQHEFALQKDNSLNLLAADSLDVKLRELLTQQ